MRIPKLLAIMLFAGLVPLTACTEIQPSNENAKIIDEKRPSDNTSDQNGTHDTTIVSSIPESNDENSSGNDLALDSSIIVVKSKDERTVKADFLADIMKQENMGYDLVYSEPVSTADNRTFYLVDFDRGAITRVDLTIYHRKKEIKKQKISTKAISGSLENGWYYSSQENAKSKTMYKVDSSRESKVIMYKTDVKGGEQIIEYLNLNTNLAEHVDYLRNIMYSKDNDTKYDMLTPSEGGRPY